jgi:hypothetical protein
MRAVLFAAVLAFGCRIDLDKQSAVARACKPSETVNVCLEAEKHSDFEWLQTNIFSTNCSGDSCHGAANPAPPSGRLDLSTGVAFATLMGTDGNGVMSEIAPGRQLVVPGDATNSYLFFILRGILADQADPPFDEPPVDIGYMPMGNNTLCCQKIDAIGRWIDSGALPPP